MGFEIMTLVPTHTQGFYNELLAAIKTNAGTKVPIRHEVNTFFVGDSNVVGQILSALKSGKGRRIPKPFYWSLDCRIIIYDRASSELFIVSRNHTVFDFIVPQPLPADLPTDCRGVSVLNGKQTNKLVALRDQVELPTDPTSTSKKQP